MADSPGPEAAGTPSVAPEMYDLARLWDHQLRGLVSAYSNMHDGRARSAAHLDELFFRLLDIAEPRLFVEAGAYRADASTRVASRFDQCRVVAFEANPHNHAAYADELTAGGIEYLNLAISNRVGTTTFHLRTSVDGEPLRPVSGNSSLLPRLDETTEYELIEVDTVALDSFFADSDLAPAALWIDVEGATGPLLAGASELLTHTDVVKIEVEERPTWDGQWLTLDVIAYFLKAGFTPLARDIEYENQFNLIFVNNAFGRDPEVLAAAELHANFMSHHLSDDQSDLESSDVVSGQPSSAPRAMGLAKRASSAVAKRIRGLRG